MNCTVLPHYRLLNSLIADWLLAIPRKPQSIRAKPQAAGCSEYHLDHTPAGVSLCEIRSALSIA